MFDFIYRIPYWLFLILLLVVIFGVCLDLSFNSWSCIMEERLEQEMLNQIKDHQQPKILLIIADCPSKLNMNKLLSARV